MDIKEIAEVLILPAVLGGYKLYLEYRKKKKYQENVKQHKDAYSVKKEAKAILNKAATDLKSDRCFLIRQTNGGGVPDGGSEIFSSIIAKSTESYEIEENRQMQYVDWDKQKIDDFLNDVTVHILENELLMISYDLIEKRWPDFKLKALYRTLRVKQVIVKLVVTKPTELYYMVYHYSKDRPELTYDDRTELNRAANNLKKLLQ